MPVVLPTPLLNDQIVDVNSRLHSVNVGTSVIFSRFEIFSSPAGNEKSTHRRAMISNNKLTVPTSTDAQQKIRLVGTGSATAASGTTRVGTSPEHHLSQRKLSVTSNYRHRATSNCSITGVPKPPIDRRSKKPSRLKRTAHGDVVGVRDEQILATTEDGKELLVADLEDHGPEDHTEPEPQRQVCLYPAPGTISEDQLSQTGSFPPPQKELKAIHHILSEVYAEPLEPELNLDLVDPKVVVRQIAYEVCRPFDVLDPAFSSRVWNMLGLSSGFREGNTVNLIKAYRVNIEPSGLFPPNDALIALRPADLVQSECFILLSQKAKSRIWTFWEFRKYLPPAKPMGEASTVREVAWGPTDCTFENIEATEVEESVVEGDGLSEESCQSCLIND